MSAAVNVRLRPGTGVSRRQRPSATWPAPGGPTPAGRLRSPWRTRDGAPPGIAAAHGGRDVGRTRRGQRHRGAMLLYAPDAVVHTGDGDRSGRRLHGWLSTSGMLGHIRAVETAGADDHIIVRWRGHRSSGPHLLDAHRARRDRRTVDRRAPPGCAVVSSPGRWARPAVELVARDPRVPAARGYAAQKVRRVIEAIGAPVLHARVQAEHGGRPCGGAPARAEAALDVNGQLVFARVTGHTPHEAVDLLEPRLRRRAPSTPPSAADAPPAPPGRPGGGWHHGDAATDRPPWYDRPPRGAGGGPPQDVRLRGAHRRRGRRRHGDARRRLLPVLRAGGRRGRRAPPGRRPARPAPAPPRGPPARERSCRPRARTRPRTRADIRRGDRVAGRRRRAVRVVPEPRDRSGQRHLPAVRRPLRPDRPGRRTASAGRAVDGPAAAARRGRPPRSRAGRTCRPGARVRE